MPSYEEVTQRAGSLGAMTGLTQQACSTLLPHFEHALLAYREDHTMDGQPRTSRRYRSYATSPVPTRADTWLFMLTYLKQNPIQEGQGQLFGMSQSKAHKWIHLLHPVVNRALAHQDLLPARPADEVATRLTTKQSKAESTPPVWHDGTERPIQRPKAPEDQQEYESGQQKCHPIKNLLVIEETCHMCFLSPTDDGKEHDQSLAALEGYTLPRGSCLYQDRGVPGLYPCWDHERPTQENTAWR